MTVRTAQWLGGPWHGETVRIDDTVWSVPAIEPEGEVADPHDESTTGPAPRVRTCPVRKSLDGRLFVVWQG